MIKHVKISLRDDDPKVDVILHTEERTLTPPLTEAQMRAALEQTFIILSCMVIGEEADVLVDYPKPTEVDEGGVIGSVSTMGEIP